MAKYSASVNKFLSIIYLLCNVATIRPKTDTTLSVYRNATLEMIVGGVFAATTYSVFANAMLLPVVVCGAFLQLATLAAVWRVKSYTIFAGFTISGGF